MPDRLWNKGKTRRPYRSKRKGATNPRLTVLITKALLSVVFVMMIWGGAQIGQLRQYLQYVFVTGAALQSPWAVWLDWQPRNELVQPVWVMLTGRQDGVEYDLPLNGEITSAFGWTTHAQTNEPVYNEGVTLSALPGTAVEAVLPGKVVEVNSATGSLTIDHGNDMYTVYRGCAPIDVKVGSKVKARESLGRLSSEGRLFFALYQAGKPHDPLLRTREGVR